jgi:REP element-mobilizing transposase RayT
MNQPPFLPGLVFHVYNHANGDEDLFRNPGNYAYFLKKYGEYLGPVVDTFAYCLMPNHFHLMIRVKPLEEVLKYLVFEKRMTVPGIDVGRNWLNHFEGPVGPLEGFREQKVQPSKWLQALGVVEPESVVNQLLSKQFSHFLNGYVQHLNHEQNRRGSLLTPNLRRKPVEDDRYFTRLITYIHQNPVHHGFTPDFRAWPHSSYRTLLSEQPTQLRRDDVLDWFGGRNAFRLAHEVPVSEAEASFS